MQVERLSSVHAERYRTLMLEAYERFPEAFTSSSSERAALLPAWWEERIAHGRGTSVGFGAFVETSLVGAVGLQFETKEKTRHKATLFGMYVQDDFRGLGFARRLVDAALAHASARPGTELVQLTLTEGNDAARRLYEACRFVAFGTEPKALKMQDGYRAKVHMWCDLRSKQTA